MPLVSVVMPCYNAQDFIAASIASVQAQTFTDWELLLVDNGSTDNSAAIYRNLSWNDDRIKVSIYTSKKGPAAARNEAIRNAAGRYLCFLDSDDLWDEHFLQEMLEFAGNGEKAFCCAAYRVISEDGLRQLSVRNVPPKATYSDILKGNTIGCLTAFVDMQQLGKNYMPQVGHEDCALWLDLLKLTDYVYGLDIPLASYRKRLSSVSGNKLRAIGFQWRLYREHEKLSLLKSLWFFINYAIGGVLK